MHFASFQGTVTMIQNFMGSSGEEGCYKLMSIVNTFGQPANFVIAPNTYFTDHAMIKIGDTVTCYYDGDAPAILIYPPQYPGIVVVKESAYKHVKVDHFNADLISSDGLLKLNISPSTRILLTNGQAFTGALANRNLIVSYGPSTKSIPAQTSPDEVIVLC